MKYILVLYVTDDGKDTDGNEGHYLKEKEIENIFDDIDLPAGVKVETVVFEEIA